MRQIVEKIILPNMSLRTSDEELFEEDPIEFIRRDLEGSDSDTRRRASADFIRGLMDKFESMITGIVMSYIQHYLNEFQVNPTAHWKSQDTAIYLLTSISTKGHISQHGVTSTNILVDIVDFLDKNILPSLTAPLDSIHPILKVDALKKKLTKDQLASVLPLFVNHLESSSYVVYTYAAICIERVLFLKRDNAFVILEPDIAPHIRTLLASLFKLIERGNTTQKLAENDFLMRCVMRVIISSHNAVVLHAQLALAHLNAILVEISKNPSNPRFNHFTFESLGALIRFTVPTSPDFVSQFETALIPTFQYILVQDVAEFTPYVFQLLAQLLEAHNEPGLTEQYKSFLVPFLSPSLWESKGNIPALVRLLEAYLLRGSEDIIAAKQIEPLLGIFQKLLASKLHDHHGFDLLQSMFIQLPLIALQPYIKQIVILLFTRLNASRTEKFTQRFALLIYLLMALEKPGFGPNFVIASMDEVQPGIFGQVFENFVLPETQKIHGSLERKTTSIGLTRLLVESEAMQAGGPYAELWHLTLMTILKLFELPQEAFDGQDIEEIDPDLDFQVSFAKLGTAARLKPDHFVAIPDPKRYLAERLGQSNQSAGGKIAIAIQTRLPQDAQSVLSSYGLVF
ncbi:Importin-alpha re-exporter [Neolecta irregularis DAH-3]|uniref:Importin-alpha re-exporter n=1 Tax=Neolecta irregularis (strain DAH-3) TaxID=1198029 RepID=A0A1U7LUH2_NEOID|nr:Importin-alpha re-exporter [Neolecta irregularis DAH-3]|eukprot:OLL26294.1 Importin-alpha re-exporter [Neolecta irregularis DAH-3]